MQIIESESNLATQVITQIRSVIFLADHKYHSLIEPDFHFTLTVISIILTNNPPTSVIQPIKAALRSE